MEKKHTIGFITAVFLIATAVVFDGIQALLTISVFLLPLSLFVTFLSGIGFSIWFALLGMSYSGRFGAARLLTMIAAMVAELAPVINALPAITAGVVALILLSRVEDARRALLPQQALSPEEQRRARSIQARQLRTQQARLEREERERTQYSDDESE